MSPWRAYLLMLQSHIRWIGTYGEMISLDLHVGGGGGGAGVAPSKKNSAGNVSHI
jgi:hypothetical protein